MAHTTTKDGRTYLNAGKSLFWLSDTFIGIQLSGAKINILYVGHEPIQIDWCRTGADAQRLFDEYAHVISVNEEVVKEENK